MLTFHGEPFLRQLRIERAEAHVTCDRLRHGVYHIKGTNRGCSVGCDAMDILGTAIGDNNCHAIVADYYGTASWLEQLRDTLYETLPHDRSLHWPIRLAEAIPVGVCLKPVFHQYFAWLLTLRECFRSALPYLTPLVELNSRVIAGEAVTALEWSKVSASVHSEVSKRYVENGADLLLEVNYITQNYSGQYGSTFRSAVYHFLKLPRVEANKQDLYERAADKLIELLQASGKKEVTNGPIT